MRKERGSQAKPVKKERDLAEKAKELTAEYEEMVEDDEIKQRAEDRHRKISRLSLRDLLRFFDR